MSRATCFNIMNKQKHTQHGFALMEALIALVIIMIIFVGSIQAMNITMKNQAKMNAKNIVLLQMHEALHTTGIENICGGSSVDATTIASNTVTFSGSCSTLDTTLTMGGASEIISWESSTLSISTSADNDINTALFGGNGVISARY